MKAERADVFKWKAGQTVDTQWFVLPAHLCALFCLKSRNFKPVNKGSSHRCAPAHPHLSIIPAYSIQHKSGFVKQKYRPQGPLAGEACGPIIMPPPVIYHALPPPRRRRGRKPPRAIFITIGTENHATSAQNDLSANRAPRSGCGKPCKTSSGRQRRRKNSARPGNNPATGSGAP